MFINLPYHAQSPWFLEYSLIQMGYVIEDFVFHVFFKEKVSDFWEMTFHHSLTLTLYGGMILQNFMYEGIVISWLHSSSDILTSFSRILSQTRFKISTVVSFGLCIIVWAWLRNYWIPKVWWASCHGLKYPPEMAHF